MNEIRLLIVPYELGLLRDGVGRGPERLLERGALDALSAHGVAVRTEVIELEDRAKSDLDASFELMRMVAARVSEAVRDGAFPVLLRRRRPCAAGCAAPPRVGRRLRRAGAGVGRQPHHTNQGGKSMTDHRIGTREEWQAARDELLEEEKELTRRNDELTQKRRELPWVPVEKQYSFETDEGTKSLAELFDGRSQLLVYHFMFGPTYKAGCPVCSSIVDNIDPNVVHLRARDVTMLLASRAPVDTLLAYKKRMGWSIDWVSSGGSDFNRDLGFMHTEDELRPFLEGETPPTVTQMAKASGTDVAGYVSEGPGMSAYTLSDGVVYRTYVATARGLEPTMGYYFLLDRTPAGRDEGGSQPLWLRRHDEY